MRTMLAFALGSCVLIGATACGGSVASDGHSDPRQRSASDVPPMTSSPVADSPLLPPPPTTTNTAPRESPAPTCTGAYPGLSKSVPNFEGRRRSTAGAVRVTLARDVGSLLPLPEAERYERDVAACDPDAEARGAAVDQLLHQGHLLTPAHLPLGIGNPGSHYPTSVADARNPLPTGRVMGGFAALYLSVYGDASDVPRMVALSKDANIFSRFSSAVALLGLSEVARATQVLDAVAREPHDPGNHFYIEQSLIMLDSMHDEGALTDLVAFLGQIENSSEPNDEVHVETVLDILAAIVGEWRSSSSEWRAWLVATGRPTVSTRR